MSTTVVPPPAAPPRPRARRRVIIWGALLGLLGLLAGVTWLLGGFDGKATPYLGREVGVGETIETRFWDISVMDVYVLVEEPTKISVKLNVVNKTDSHSTRLTPGMVLIRIEETGQILVTTACDFHNRSNYNPFISTGSICEFSYEYNEITDPPTEDFRARIIVLDQEMQEDLLTGAAPAASNVVANVHVNIAHLSEEEL